ncbi:MAG: hypothetical protein Q8P41_08815 [Pseudomonadota bacterium]|nr:hypothetical protein [Pseudomonadota bacterium]
MILLALLACTEPGPGVEDTAIVDEPGCDPVLDTAASQPLPENEVWFDTQLADPCTVDVFSGETEPSTYIRVYVDGIAGDLSPIVTLYDLDWNPVVVATRSPAQVPAPQMSLAIGYFNRAGAWHVTVEGVGTENHPVYSLFVKPFWTEALEADTPTSTSLVGTVPEVGAYLIGTSLLRSDTDNVDYIEVTVDPSAGPLALSVPEGQVGSSSTPVIEVYDEAYGDSLGEAVNPTPDAPLIIEDVADGHVLVEIGNADGNVGRDVWTALIMEQVGP